MLLTANPVAASSLFLNQPRHETRLPIPRQRQAHLASVGDHRFCTVPAAVAMAAGILFLLLGQVMIHFGFENAFSRRLFQIKALSIFGEVALYIILL